MSETIGGGQVDYPSHEKYWEGLSIEAKIEKLAYITENHERRINELQTMNNVQAQVKIVDGQQYVPAHLINGGLNQMIGGRNWLLNRKPRD
jgi:hypothetical protein